MRAFGHSVLVPTKLEMIRYAVETSLHFHEELENKVKTFLNSVLGYNERRNDIAHGQVMKIPEGYYLFPPLTTSKKYKPFEGEAPKPAYCWTAGQISRYCRAFQKLEDDCAPLRQEVGAVTERYAAIEAQELLQRTSSLAKGTSTDES